MAAARGVSVSDAEAALTAGIAIGRLVTAEEVAAVVTFLASPLSVAITGDAIAAGGGARGPIHYYHGSRPGRPALLGSQG
jgi:enoyl-[acyl-carrier-protein] reductase (NADH)